MQISATIITLNEESNIGDAIRTVDWADEVLVVDANSTDDTREIATGLGARVITREWTGFSDQKQFAAENTEHDLIFSIDADERVSPSLAAEIKAKIIGRTRSEICDGYRTPRLSVYMGREIRHTGWYPDRQLRLYDRSKGRWNGRLIHESVQMVSGSKICDLRNDLLHFSVSGPREHARMIAERYAPISARQMLESGVTTSYLKIMGAGLAAFSKDYLVKLGFLGGVPGLSISLMSGYAATLKHLMLYEMQSQHVDPSSDLAE